MTQKNYPIILTLLMMVLLLPSCLEGDRQAGANKQAGAERPEEGASANEGVPGGQADEAEGGGHNEENNNDPAVVSENFTTEWVRRWGLSRLREGQDAIYKGRAIAAAPDGGIYVTVDGRNRGEIDPQGGVAVAEFTGDYYDHNEYLYHNLLKYGADGQLQWNKVLTANMKSSRLMVANDQNQIFIFGYNSILKIDGRTQNELLSKRIEDANGQSIQSMSISRVKINGDAIYAIGSDKHSGLNSPGPYRSDIATYKFDSNGNLLWRRSVGTPQGIESGRQIDFDAHGNIYVTGIIEGDHTVNGLQANGAQDLAILKYNPEGELLWMRRGPTMKIYQDMIIANDSMYILANEEGQEPMEEIRYFIEETHHSIGREHIVLRYDLEGRQQEVHRFALADNLLNARREHVYNRLIRSNNHVYIASNVYEERVVVRSSIKSPVLIKLAPSGNRESTQSILNEGYFSSEGIIANQLGDFYLIGSSRSTNVNDQVRGEGVESSAVIVKMQRVVE